MTEYKIINKNLMMIRHHPSSSWICDCNIFEYAKYYLIATAYDKFKNFLPYSNNLMSWPRIPDDLPVRDWFGHLSPDNPPGKFNPRNNPDLFRQLIEPLDFTKPVNWDIINSIRSQFMGDTKKQEVVLDAAEIEQEQ